MSPHGLFTGATIRILTGVCVYFAPISRTSKASTDLLVCLTALHCTEISSWLLSGKNISLFIPNVFPDEKPFLLLNPSQLFKDIKSKCVDEILKVRGRKGPCQHSLNRQEESYVLRRQVGIQKSQRTVSRKGSFKGLRTDTPKQGTVKPAKLYEVGGLLYVLQDSPRRLQVSEK